MPSVVNAILYFQNEFQNEKNETYIITTPTLAHLSEPFKKECKKKQELKIAVFERPNTLEQIKQVCWFEALCLMFFNVEAREVKTDEREEFFSLNEKEKNEWRNYFCSSSCLHIPQMPSVEQNFDIKQDFSNPNVKKIQANERKRKEKKILKAIFIANFIIRQWPLSSLVWGPKLRLPPSEFSDLS